jgi:type IV secretory pathway TrbL component
MSAMLRQIVDRFDVMAYPIVALLLFVAVFAYVVTRVRAMRPSEVERLAALPLARAEGEEG